MQGGRDNRVVRVLLVANGNQAAVKGGKQASPNCERSTQPPGVRLDRFDSPRKTLSSRSISSSLE